MTKYPRLPAAGNVFEAKYTPKQMREYAEKYAAMKVEAEREACAQLCDHLWESKGSQAYECATAIRNRADE